MSGGVDKRSALVDEALRVVKDKMRHQSLNLLRADEMLREAEHNYRAGTAAPSRTIQTIRQIEGALGL